MAYQPFLSRNAQVAGGSSRSHDDAAGFVILAAGLHGEQPGGFILMTLLTSSYANRVPNFSACCCIRNIRSGPITPSGKPGKFFHLRGGGQLSADLGARNEKRREIGAGGVNGRRVACAACADDNDLFAHNMCK